MRTEPGSWKRFWALLASIGLLAGTVGAESAHFRRLSVEDGLSASSVESIAEDRFGFLWFGTQEGLNQFDGYGFTSHQASSEPGHLHDGYIRAITPDRSGDLWIGTSRGLQHLDVATGRFSESVTPPGVGVRLGALVVSADGRVWFAGNTGGLWTRAGGGDGEAHRTATDIIPPTTAVAALALDSNGDLLVAAARNLYRFSSTGESATPIELKNVVAGVGAVSTIYSGDGGVWLGRFDSPPVRIDSQSGERTEYRTLPPYTLTIVPAGGGRLWFGGKGAGATLFDPSTGKTVTYRHEPGNAESLAEDDVAVIYQDRGGSLWVGAWNGGLSRLDLHSQAFRTLRYTPGQPQSLPDDDVTRMAEGSDGRLWVVTRNDVLASGNPVEGSFVRHPLDGDLTSIAILGDALFAGTADELVQLDAASGDVIPLPPKLRAEGLDRVAINALDGGTDHLWISAEGIIYRVTRDHRVEKVRLPDQHQTPVSIFAASPSVLWIAYEDGTLLRADVDQGLLKVRRVGKHRFTSHGRLSFVTEHQGIVWIGAARGLGRLDPERGRVKWVDMGRGLPSRSVTSIVGDDEGTLWIATERGITRFDPQAGEVRHFGGVQGAQSSGYVEGGAARGKSGRIYFAGRGITVFDPRRVTGNPNPPEVLFSSLEILHRPVDPAWMEPGSPLSTQIHAAEELTLQPDATVFSIEMAAPGVSDPDSVLFSHKLDGFDDEWIETGAERRLATYTRLAPGEYVLRARARARSGEWSGDEAVLRINVLPPWWRTPPAVASWIVLALLLAWLLVREAQRRTRVRIALAEQDVLRRTSVTDPLTGLYNRRFLTEWLRQEIPRILRTYHPENSSAPESLLLIAADLDNLKKINDRSGHERGDRAIRAVADLLASHARSGDVAVRLGGDEFLLILRLADRRNATGIVERLRTKVDALDLSSAETERATISLGYAAFPFIEREPDSISWEQTLQLADLALLRSKRRGRNAWSGFVAGGSTSARAIDEFLKEGAEGSPAGLVEIIDGPLAEPVVPVKRP